MPTIRAQLTIACHYRWLILRYRLRLIDEVEKPRSYSSRPVVSYVAGLFDAESFASVVVPVVWLSPY